METDLKILIMKPGRWSDLVSLFGSHGASGGCWCMYFREASSDFKAHKGEVNKNLFQNIVDTGLPVGLLAYASGEPAGWIAVAPRNDYPRILNSRNYRPKEDLNVWSITCFFVGRKFRGKGLHKALIVAALDYAREEQVEWVEAYPVDTRHTKIQDASAYTGIYDTFSEIGFTEVDRRSPSAPIVRYHITQN